jgi:hypothetical protein
VGAGKKGTWRALIAAVASVALLPSVHAAKIVPLQGEIRVTSGAGFQRIVGAVELKPGDAAIAMPSAQASLIYDDGCTIDLVPGMVAWIEPTSPCEAKKNPVLKPLVPRVFDPAWLVDGAAQIKRNSVPAGP